MNPANVQDAVESLGRSIRVTMTAVGDSVSFTSYHPAGAALGLCPNEADDQSPVIAPDDYPGPVRVPAG